MHIHAPELAREMGRQQGTRAEREGGELGCRPQRRDELAQHTGFFAAFYRNLRHELGKERAQLGAQLVRHGGELAIVREQRGERETGRFGGAPLHVSGIARNVRATVWGTAKLEACAGSRAFGVVVSDLPIRLPSHQRVRITFVRHGESVSNRSGRWQGQGDSPLSERGISQAKAVGERLKRRKFDRVISSDLSRAHDTARASGFALVTSRAWREFDVGTWEGLTREEVMERYPEEMERLKAGEDVPLGGGESYAAFSARIEAALSALLASLEGHEADVLVVCHGGVIATVMAGVLGLRGHKRWPLFRAANTSLTELTFAPDGKHELRVFNDTHHLAPLGGWPGFEDVSTCLALVSGAAPHADFGAFAAHYDEASRFAGLLELAEASGAESVSALLSAVHAKHPSERVSVALRAELIRAWVSESVWLGGAPTAEIVLPLRGALSHVGFVGGKAQLLDFNVSGA